MERAVRLSKIPNSKIEAYTTFNELRAICLQDRDSICLGKAEMRLGLMTMLDEQYADAIQYYNQALKHYSDTTDQRFFAMIKMYKGFAYQEINDMERAREEFKGMLSYKLKENSRLWNSAYINIGSTYTNPDSLYFYSEKITRNCTPDSEFLVDCYIAYNNVANSFLSKNEPQKALEIMNDNIDLEICRNFSTDVQIYLAAAHSYGQIHHALGQYEQSIEYYKKCLEPEKTANRLAYVIKVKNDMSKSYEVLGNYVMALELSRELDSLEQIFNENKLKKEIANLEAKRILETAEEQIVDLEKSKSQIEEKFSVTKTWLYVLLGIVLLSLSIILVNRYRSKLRLYKLNEELSLSRLQSLRNVMNPHFLFNSFSTLQNFILKKDHLKANEYMTSLSELIRTVLDSSNNVFIPLDKEFDMLCSYVEIESGRFQHKFVTRFNISEVLKTENPMIPAMIVQPYIENAILHGFANLDREGLLEISFEKQSKVVRCTISDNGVGRKKAAENKGNHHLSIATMNTQKRLEILNKMDYPDGSIKIIDKNSDHNEATGTTVIIDLPIKAA